MLPENIEPHASTGNGCVSFDNAIFSHLVDTEESARLQYGNVVWKGQGFTLHFAFKLAMVKDQPWAQVTLA